jgi:hypothetical protein
MMAAAAAIVMAVGVGIIQMKNSGQRGTGAPTGVAATTTIPTDMSGKLVAVHDSCSRLAPLDHHFFKAAPKSDFKAIETAMSADLRHPVIARDLGDHWEFRGASECPVGSMKSAHLLYARRTAFVSVFSLPASAFPTIHNHENCDANVSGHPVAGFVEDGGFYAVVASSAGDDAGAVDVQQVRALRDQLHKQAVAISHEPPREPNTVVLTLAEAMR